MFKDFKSIPVKLNQILDKRRKVFLFVLLFMAVLFSVVETAGISVVMPFITVASNPELIYSGYYKFFYDLFKFSEPNSFIFSFGIVIIAFYFLRAGYTIFYNYSINKYSLGAYRFFAGKLFKIYLSLPFKIFVQKNPSVFSQMIIVEASNLSNLLMRVLYICSESFTILFLYFFMVFVNWQITLVVTMILILFVFLVFMTLIRASKKLGDKRLEASLNLSKTITETFRLFKFIKLKGNENEIFEVFNDSTSKVSHTSVMTNTMSSIPKSILENIGFSLLIAAVCYILWRYNSASMVIPVISMYALALYRILPATNRILDHVNTVAFHQQSLNMIYDDLHFETDREGSAPLAFSGSISGKNLSFSYLRGSNVIKNVSFKINKGEKVAFTGESGSGKTTLVDIIIGIYTPQQGGLYADDTLIDSSNILSWRSKIGYIPQNIYLFDGTVAENVSFGSKPDENKIMNALKTARIWEFLESKEGLFTRVGEGGIQLSGGQKQRIGIARALYNDPEVLVLDEATSSLDDTTEAQIMDEIYDLSGNKTLIIIAHRLTTVQRCDRKILIENGKIAGTL
jgi:ATP-binding cassette subfamily B protein/ATP-binding cassette subfamily C protein